MKKIFNIFGIAAAALALASCAYDEIDQHDNLSEYKGVTGQYVYIEEGTQVLYNQTLAEVQHTPIGEIGTIEKSFVVALTEAQPKAVTVKVGVDDDALTGSNVAFPEGVLEYDQTVTIPAGELTDTVKVSVSNSNFPKLEEAAYQAVFKILEVQSGDVAISSNSNKAYLFVTTETIDPADDIISVEGGTTSFTITHYTDKTDGKTISKTITVTGTEEAFQEFEVKFEVDNSLIAAYNEENGTTYKELSSSLYTLTNATMSKDATTAYAYFSVPDDNWSELTDSCLVPIVLKDASPATVANNTVTYIAINVKNIDGPSDQFSALYLGDKEMSCWYKFKEGIDVTSGFVYVFHVFTEENVGQQRICNIADKDEGFINMMRLGQDGNGENLEWWVGYNGYRQKLYGKVTAQAWHQIGLVYDGSTYSFYVDMELQDSYTLTDDDKAANSSITFQGIEFANSWGDSYRSPYKGRMWNFSVWTKPEFYDYALYYSYMGIADWYINWYADYYGGLKAYWKMDEGEGYVLKDTMGWEDIDLSKATRCNDEVNFVDFDASPYVQWKRDEYNVTD